MYSYCSQKKAKFGVLVNGVSAPEIYEFPYFENSLEINRFPRNGEALQEWKDNRRFTIKQLMQSDRLQNETLKDIILSVEQKFGANDSSEKAFEELFKLIFSKLYEDRKLHRFYRRVNLMESIDEFKQNTLVIQDDTIDMESNLWYVVLQKNLYKVGLPVDLFDEYAKDIDALVNRRNSIAHGNEKSGISEAEYTKWESKIYTIMEDIIKVLYRNASEEQYLKSR